MVMWLSCRCFTVRHRLHKTTELSVVVLKRGRQRTTTTVANEYYFLFSTHYKKANVEGSAPDQNMSAGSCKIQKSKPLKS